MPISRCSPNSWMQTKGKTKAKIQRHRQQGHGCHRATAKPRPEEGGLEAKIPMRRPHIGIIAKEKEEEDN